MPVEQDVDIGHALGGTFPAYPGQADKVLGGNKNLGLAKIQLGPCAFDQNPVLR